MALALLSKVVSMIRTCGSGSGNFGQWGVDQWGLPVYHYTDNEISDPRAQQSELAGGTGAQHQVGNVVSGE